MKHIRLLLSDARRHRGLALIIVLSMLALATIVILAFLSVADTENKATNIYSASQASRRFADTAVNVVISQLRAGAAREVSGVPVIHATQPGAVRKYAASGSFLAGYKLFSDQNMVFRAAGGTLNSQEEKFVTDSEPPAQWNFPRYNGRYVDINEPVIKGVVQAAGRNDDQGQVFFPIIDPRAGQDMDATDLEVPIEGFSYALTTALGKQNISEAVNPDEPKPIMLPSQATAGPGANQLRLAMPVQWLYILKDGAVGYLNDTMQFRVLANAEGIGDGPSVTQTANYGVPSDENPIVGRVAFWTDDETCKVNINTAAEPTYAGQPIYYHERDHRWADYPPARSEYQRFPGHPATVALSSILFPNPLQIEGRNLETYPIKGPAGRDDIDRAVAIKQRIYDLMPRIHTGGSKAGTLAFEQDDYQTAFGDNTDAKAIAIQEAAAERLYASVDELLFAQGAAGGKRVLNQASVSNNAVLFNKMTLERASAFLTAHSRGSEINLFGLPRIAMWPIPLDTTKRTGFDELINFCSRLGPSRGTRSNLYAFQRDLSQFRASDGKNAAQTDIGIGRNQELLRMLDQIMQQNFPTATDAGTASAVSFRQKLGLDNSRQVLVSMFDYIRCTNLYDSYRAPERSEWPAGNTGDWTAMYKLRDSSASGYKTFTPGTMKNSGDQANRYADRTMPGHGQVTPSESEWKASNGDSIRGFGRFISLSEVGLQFICTADGQPDMYSWRLPVKDVDPAAPPGSFVIPVANQNALDGLAGGTIPTISGGRTALRVNEANLNGFQVEHYFPTGFDGGTARLTNTKTVKWNDTNSEGQIKRRYYSNYPPLRNATQAGRYGTTGIATGVNDPNYGRYYQRHPGYDWRNWNWTLDYDTPLAVNQKRVQALLHLEFFCPAAAYTELFPDYTIVISGDDMSNIQVDGRAIFSSTEPIALRSERPMFDTDSHPEIGGFASFRNVALGRRVGPRGNMPEDLGFETNATAQVHSGLVNMDLVSSFFTVRRDQTLAFSSGQITVKIYDHHVQATTSDLPVQVIQFRLPDGQAPTPDLITAGSYLVNYVNTGDGSTYNHPAIQAPRWWSFNRDGAIGRFDTAGNPNPNLEGATNRSLRGRFFRWDGVSINTNTRAYDPRQPTGNNQSVPGAYSLIYSKDAGNYADVEMQRNQVLLEQPVARIGYGPRNIAPNGVTIKNENGNYNRPWHFGSDVVRTLQPVMGDARIIAAKKTVPESDWAPHRLWNDANEYMAHNFSSYTAGTEPGFDRGFPNTSDEVDLATRGLPSKVILDGTSGRGAGRTPDVPSTMLASRAVQRYYDFDDSDPGGRIGPYINKVDEGNYSVGDVKLSGWTEAKKWRSTYFRASSVGTRFASGSLSYFTPNRMVASPVVMGSLPSRIWDDNSQGSWVNLLFHPYVQYNQSQTGSAYPAEATHPGELTPPDHYLLDLFWMPVVEPYAISEALSTAGKINLNYQMLPFTHIRRATAIHAAMKGEMMAAIPNAQYEQSKNVLTNFTTNGARQPSFQSERENKFWHRGIVIDRFAQNNRLWYDLPLGQLVEGTLRQFEERFNFGKGATGGPIADTFRGGLFRTASQLCEVHLIPTPVAGQSGPGNLSAGLVDTYTSRRTSMENFWGAHCATGDNTRERPYSNLYAKFTTRSNTFRVHVRAQSIRKAQRSVAADVFNPEKDLMSGEFRGSFLIERYIDQSDFEADDRARAVDYAGVQNPFGLKPLENYYRFRIIESKRFAP